MIFPKRILSASLVVAITGLALAACGGDADVNVPNDQPTPPQDTAAATLELQPQPEVVQDLDPIGTEDTDGTLEVTAADVAFAPNRLGVGLGEEVTIRVTNNDGVPHNLRIAGIDGEYLTDDDAVTIPETIGNGDTGELTGFAPTVAGDYSFRCDFHPGQMGGQIEVE